MENNSNFYKKDANDSQLDNSNSNVVATTSNQNCLSQQQNDNNFHPKNDLDNQNFYQNYSNECNENYPNFGSVYHFTQKQKNRMGYQADYLTRHMNVYSHLRESAKLNEYDIKKVNAMSFWLIGLTLGYITFVLLSIYYGFSLFENTNNWIILTAMIVIAVVFMIVQAIILGILKKRLEYTSFSTKGYRFAINFSGLILFGTSFSALCDFLAADGLFMMILIVILFIVFFVVFFALSAISALFMPFIVASFIIKKCNKKLNRINNSTMN